jgi:hypothetical protein
MDNVLKIKGAAVSKTLLHCCNDGAVNAPVVEAGLGAPLAVVVSLRSSECQCTIPFDVSV